MILDNRLYVARMLPDGTTASVRLFHISMEGLEKSLICRDEEDYDVMVKNIFLCAKRENVIVVIYGVVSNHAHIAVLATAYDCAQRYANALKKVQSMWIRRKYGDIGILLGKETDISEVETIDYARNVLAYIPRNALDNGAVNINQYKWTGFRAFFCGGQVSVHTAKVSHLSTRRCESIMHTGSDLSDVPWLLNDSGEIEPASACDWQYLEEIYGHNQSFFLRKIGSVNSAEMIYRQAIEHHKKFSDSEYLIVAGQYARDWFQTDISNMTTRQKVRFLQYLDKKLNLSVPQVSRCMNMDRKTVAKILGRKTGNAE